MARDESRHPDAERLAEYADGVLEAGARAEVERHLADCADCRAVVMETMAFLESPAAELAPSATVIPFRSRRWVTGVAAGLAVAAALVIAIRVARPEWVFGPRGDRPELQELIAAVANEPTRPVEGRLSGGFKYAPPPSPTRGPGDRELSPEARIAAAELEKGAGTSAAAGDAARGVAMLVRGSLDAAIAALESAVRSQPENALFQSDLAAAYVARGKAKGVTEDFPLAIAAADRAIKLKPDLGEAWFNRAVALESSTSAADARRGWLDAAQHQTDSAWRSEAQSRADALIKPAP